MKNITKNTLIAVASLLTIGTAAEAAPFTYSFTSPTGNNLSSPQNLTSTPPGFPGTITAFKNLPSLTAGTFNIDATTGLGVSGDPRVGTIGRDANNTEAARITIPGTPSSPSYKLTSVTFSNLITNNVGNRTITVAASGGTTFSTAIPGTAAVTLFDYMNSNLVGNSFDLYPTDTNNSRFRVVSATFDTVPEPLTILGTGFAVAALPALKKAHKKGQKKIS
jgi:hypothetical protein